MQILKKKKRTVFSRKDFLFLVSQLSPIVRDVIIILKLFY